MHFNFDEKINDFLKIIVSCADKLNINVYFVGGIVRDNILNKPLKDIDLIVDKNAIEFVKVLPEEIKLKSIHEDFCTAKIEYRGIDVDIATTRQEHYEYPGSLPVVDKIGVGIEKDCLRRDFTINSMYAKIDLTGDSLTYKLIDYVSGCDDIKNKTLRVLHKNSYTDDPTRIIRGINFKNRFNFDFSTLDKELIKDTLNGINLQNASYDRIISVFKLVLYCENNFKDIVLNKCYKLINPVDIECDLDFISNVISEFKISNPGEFYLKILLNEDIKPCKFDNIVNMQKEFSKLKDYELAYYFYKTKDNAALKYLEIKNIKTFISGSDLINLGFCEGKKLGDILNALLEHKLNNPKSLVTKEEELLWVKNNFLIST